MEVLEQVVNLKVIDRLRIYCSQSLQYCPARSDGFFRLSYGLYSCRIAKPSNLIISTIAHAPFVHYIQVDSLHHLFRTKSFTQVCASIKVSGSVFTKLHLIQKLTHGNYILKSYISLSWKGQLGTNSLAYWALHKQSVVNTVQEQYS